MSSSTRSYLLVAVLLLCACSEGAGTTLLETETHTDETWLSDGGIESSEQALDLRSHCRPGSEPLARDVALREIAVYQAIKVPIVQQGTWLTERPAPIVQNKDTLVRAFVDPLPSRYNRPLRAILTLVNGLSRRTLVANLTPTQPSNDASLATTLNFRVQPSDVRGATRFSLAVVDPTCTDQGANPRDVRFPRSGTRALEATRIGNLRVVVVPLVSNGITPDTSATQLNALRTSLLARYPVPAVDLTVHAPVLAPAPITPNGGGMPQALERVRQLRDDEAPASDVYYYGLFTPTATYQTFCATGCLLGLGILNTNAQAQNQAAIGIGYPEEIARVAMSRYLGYSHGRRPVACNASTPGADPDYPYLDGVIGAWGWDSRSNTLIAPTTRDLMSQCTPTWLSDYTYAGLAARSLAVNSTF